METSCLLIVPYYTSGEGSILKSFDYTMPPVGLLSIAGWLQQNKIKVNLLDFTIENFKKNNVEDILQNKIKSIGVPEWFGISVCTPVAYNAYYISKIIKTYYPESKIVLGGPHITVLKEQIFSECEHVDYLITGEGEYSLCNLIKYNDLSPNNILTRHPNPNINKVDAEEIKIHELPLPAYNLLDFKKYTPPPGTLNSKKPGIEIITSRGCPYQCVFCARITGHKLRFKTIDQVINEIKYLQKTFNIKQFHFYDDTITCKKQYITDLCNRMIEENLNLHWSCFTRVDTVDEEILTLMRKAGCFLIMYGVESLDEKILKDIKKGISIEQINKALKLTRKAKIESRVSLIIGTATETRETLSKTKKDLLKLDTDFFQVFIAVPMPGSQFFIDAKAENRIINENWSDYDLSKVLYRHPIFSEKELFKVQRSMYMKFYLRPRIIFNFLKKLTSFTALANMFRGILGFLKIIRFSK